MKLASILKGKVPTQSSISSYESELKEFKIISGRTERISVK